MRLELVDAEIMYRSALPNAVPALSPTTLAVGTEECVAVVGPTGSGKTTLLDCLAGLRVPTRGGAAVVPGGAGAVHRRHVGLVAQFPEDQFFEETVFDEVAFGLRRRGIDEACVRERVADALGRAALDPSAFMEREPLGLSAGEARRAAIACILVLERPFLLLDEPTAGLDPGTRNRVVELIRAERGAGTGIVFVTHDLDVAAELANRVIVVRGGCVVTDGPPDEVFSRVDELEELGLEPPLEFSLVAELERIGAVAAPEVRRALTG